jgi:hypothetical protein
MSLHGEDLMSARRLVTGIMSAVVATIVFAAATSPADAWGSKGHRLVGLVAKELLATDARAAVTAIMGSDDLATFALFLDQNKMQLDKQIPGSREWHFDDVPVCGTQPHDVYCKQGNCASTQIPAHRKDLTDSHSSTADRKFAIQVLTHLIGDIHQPLHAADNDDRGGNNIKVSVPGPGGGAKKTVLHSVWDTNLVEGLVAHDYPGKSEVAVAKALVTKYADRAKSENWTSGTVDDWIAASHKLAADVAYGTLPGGFACGKDMEQTRIGLTPDYLAAGEKLVEEQIAKAGYRLADVLNKALGE